MGPSHVTVDSLTVDFGGLTALGDVSLSIEAGEFFTLVGPSGCGKTTLLRSIAGLETPTTGWIRVAGEDVTGEPPEERNVGMVFQSYALFPHMSVRENVAYGLQFHEIAQADGERVDELLDLVDMAGLADREPAQLSGGQQQRVSLARALAPKPDVLLLDEPLSALDAKLRKRLRVRIKSIQQELGITTVYVTHDQSEALAISDRVAVMHDGSVEQIATPEAVYREPESQFVAEFVGDNNVFSGVVSDGRLDVGGATLPLPAESDHADGESLALAVRPEALSIEGDGPEDEEGSPTDCTELRATVETVEFLGDAYRVHCAWEGHAVVVKTESTEPPEGEAVLRFDADETRTF